MQTQHSSRSGFQGGDFSSALTHARAARSPETQEKASTANRPGLDAYEPYNNRNISSIVSRISDEGPARLKQHSRNVAQNNQQDAGLQAWQLPDDTYTPATPTNDHRSLPHSAGREQGKHRIESEASNRTRIPLSQQLVLLAVVVMTVVMAVLLFRIDQQANQLQDAQDRSAKQFQGVNAERSELLPKLTNLDKALAEMRVELQHVKSVQQQTNSRLSQARVENVEPHLAQMAATSEQVGVLKRQLEHMQNEVQEMEGELEVMKTGKPTEMEPLSPLPQIKPIPVTRTGRLVVNLASLASEEKARSAYDRLVDAGVLPMIEQTMVDGRKTYRITVDGFSSRESAQAFIQEANEKHGFEGGWIRQH